MRIVSVLFVVALSIVAPLALLSKEAVAAGMLSRQGPSSSVQLALSADGLALSKFPAQSQLSGTVTVSEISGVVPVIWQASSNQRRLTVTRSGPGGGTLTVTVHPTGLSVNTLYIATVTVTPATARGSAVTLRVGFWQGATNPTTVTVQQNVTAIVANPVEPVVYVSDGGSSILAYNVYTGTLLRTIHSAASTIAALAISSDGQTLFAADSTNSVIRALNADTGKATAAIPLGHSVGYGFNMVYARPFGQPAIYASGGSIFAYPSGAVLASGLPSEYLAVTPDGTKVYGLVTSMSPGTLSRYSVTQKPNGLALNYLQAVYTKGSNCQDLAVSADGSRVYPACGGPYEFDVYNGTTLALTQVLEANHYPDCAVVAANGNFVGGLNGIYDPADVYVFNPQGTLVGTVPTTSQSYSWGQGSAQLVVSGDSTRVISATAAVFNASQTLMFRSLP